MSWSPDPIPGDRASVNAVETLIVPRAVYLGIEKCAVPCLLPSGRLRAVHLLRPDGTGGVPG